MRCGDIASRPIATIRADATLEEAIDRLAEHDVGALLIVDREGEPVGIITERDVVRALAGRAPLTVTVDKVGTTSGLITVSVDDPVQEAAEKMRRHGVRHLIVLDKSGRPYGIISIRDLLKVPEAVIH
ncbi:MAG: CBS domain-containing protein [Thermoproteus sp. AZ2]|jgi:CBS domain-containing protein|uniref:CBS domain-containing protein n=1 Tax=Thermoproteus sp. AZ2 TaxID=1609232 RepID=A0ACC6V314_9CREN